MPQLFGKAFGSGYSGVTKREGGSRAHYPIIEDGLLIFTHGLHHG